MGAPAGEPCPQLRDGGGIGRVGPPEACPARKAPALRLVPRARRLPQACPTPDAPAAGLSRARRAYRRLVRSNPALPRRSLSNPPTGPGHATATHDENIGTRSDSRKRSRPDDAPAFVVRFRMPGRVLLVLAYRRSRLADARTRPDRSALGGVAKLSTVRVPAGPSRRSIHVSVQGAKIIDARGASGPPMLRRRAASVGRGELRRVCRRG